MIEEQTNPEPTPVTLEESLHTLPLAPLPPGFVRQVMVQVAAQPQTAPPRFRLQFLDVALALALGGFMILLLSTAVWYLEQSDAGWLPALMAQIGQMAQSETAVLLWFLIAAAIAAEIALGIFVCVQLWQDRPYTLA